MNPVRPLLPEFLGVILLHWHNSNEISDRNLSLKWHLLDAQTQLFKHWVIHLLAYQHNHNQNMFALAYLVFLSEVSSFHYERNPSLISPWQIREIQSIRGANNAQLMWVFWCCFVDSRSCAASCPVHGRVWGSFFNEAFSWRHKRQLVRSRRAAGCSQ